MLKIFFWALLAANAALFGYQQGYLETLWPSGREPARMRNQLNADKLRLSNEPGAKAAATTATPATGEAASDTAFGPAVAVGPQATPAPSAPAVPAPAASTPAQQGKAAVLACAEVGNFTPAEAKRFEGQLAPLALASKPVRREVRETSSHMILIPPAEGKDGADRQVAVLRRLGIDDVYVIQENSALRWGISLGIFKTEEAARARMQLLGQKGVSNARMVEYKVPLNRVAFQLRDLDARAREGLAKIKANFPRQEMRSCS